MEVVLDEFVIEQANAIRGQGLTCWEAKKCGRSARHPSGHDGRFCPVPVTRHCEDSDSITYSGKCCWLVKGALCKKIEKLPGVWVEESNCEDCFFFLSNFTFDLAASP